jgi:hypothetical protein
VPRFVYLRQGLSGGEGRNLLNLKLSHFSISTCFGIHVGSVSVDQAAAIPSGCPRSGAMNNAKPKRQPLSRPTARRGLGYHRVADVPALRLRCPPSALRRSKLTRQMESRPMLAQHRDCSKNVIAVTQAKCSDHDSNFSATNASHCEAHCGFAREVYISQSSVTPPSSR